MELPKGINILVTGTPGTGKTSLCASLVEELADLLPFEHIEVGKVVKEHKFYTEFDSEFETHIIEEDDEDKLLDYLEPIMVKQGNHLVDYHSSELFPERWFHLVVVLHASTEQLFDRLEARNYNERKRIENLDAEIEMVCENEARDSYKENILMICNNDNLEDMAKIVEQIRGRVEELKAQRNL